jgi:hypothetical protein
LAEPDDQTGTSGDFLAADPLTDTRRKTRMRRVLMLAATLAIPVSGVALAVTGTQAWAAAKGPNGKVACTTITGNDTSTITVSGCTDSGSADTGTGTEPIEAADLATGGTITWLSGKTTTINAPNLVSTSAKKCPGYVKSTKKDPYSGSEPSADKVSGTVASDTSGLKLPGSFKGAVCISQSGAVTALKPFKVK